MGSWTDGHLQLIDNRYLIRGIQKLDLQAPSLKFMCRAKALPKPGRQEFFNRHPRGPYLAEEYFLEISTDKERIRILPDGGNLHNFNPFVKKLRAILEDTWGPIGKKYKALAIELNCMRKDAYPGIV